MAIRKKNLFFFDRKVVYLLLLLTLPDLCIPKSINKSIKCASLDDISLNNLDTCYLDPSITNICNKLTKMTYFNYPPYSDIINVNVLYLIIYQCCGYCTSANLTTRFIPHLASKNTRMEAFTKSLPTSADLAFPATGKSSMTMKFGYHFIPIIRKPNLVYVTPLHSSAFERAVTSGANLYALILVCVLMSFVFGFIYWLIESKIIKKDGKPFGWASAVWWSIITLFSQGLEKNPRSLVMRVLSILWLLVAVIMMALITSILTANMVEPVPAPTMDAKKVGTLSNRLYNNHTIKKNGGTIVIYPTAAVTNELYVLMQNLKNNTIDGILIDKHLLSYAMLFIRDIGKGLVPGASMSGDMGAVLTYFQSQIVRTEFENEDDLYYGVLVKDQEVYEYIRHAVAAHWLHFTDWFLQYSVMSDDNEEARMKRVKQLTERPMFSMDESYVQQGLIYLSALVVAVIIALWVYESRTKICCWI